MLKLGLRLALMDVLDTFCIGKTMTCDRCLVPAACIAYSLAVRSGGCDKCLFGILFT